MLVVSVLSLASAVGCQEEVSRCLQPIAVTNSATNVTITSDKNAPDAAATITGTWEAAYDCDVEADEYELGDAAIFEVDQTTKIADIPAFGFAGGSVKIAPGNCSALGHASVHSDIEATGPLNSELASHCGQNAWLTAHVQRTDCGDSSEQSKIGAQVFIACP